MRKDSNITLLEIIEDEPRVSHIVIAEKTENKPKSILDLITRNIDDFEEFGAVRFKIAVLKAGKGTTKSKEYFLNEQQATLLMTYLRNSSFVKNFKKQLVKEFFEMRTELQKKPTTKVDIPQLLEESEALLKLIKFSTENPDYQLAILDKIMGDKSPLKLLNIDFSNRFFIPTELGKIVGRTPIEINKILEFKGYQVKIDGVWSLTEKGKKLGIEVKGKFSQLKWKLEAVL